MPAYQSVRLHQPGQPVDQDQQFCQVRGSRPGFLQHKLALHLAHCPDAEAFGYIKLLNPQNYCPQYYDG